MLKIIHYIPDIDRSHGGTATYMQLLGEKLGQQCEVHIVTHKTAFPVDIKNCNIHYINRNIFGAMKREWMEILNDVKPNIVHVNCCWTPQCAWVQKWSQAMGYKVILTPHGMLEPWIIKRNYWTKKLPALLLYQKKAICKADYIHATAESEKEHILQLGYNDKVEVIPNAVNVESIEMKGSWKRTNNILFLSRVHEKKGINFLIEAVATLKEKLKGYKIIIAGEGEPAYIATLKQTTVDLGVQEQVVFVGGVYSNEKWRLFREADVFVLPTFSENFGIAIAEALASGTPVITTNGTPWDDIKEHTCGWFTKIGTEPTIDALKEFLSFDEESLELMGRNGRKLIEEKYSINAITEKMIELYKDLL